MYIIYVGLRLLQLIISKKKFGSIFFFNIYSRKSHALMFLFVRMKNTFFPLNIWCVRVWLPFFYILSFSRILFEDLYLYRFYTYSITPVWHMIWCMFFFFKCQRITHHFGNRFVRSSSKPWLLSFSFIRQHLDIYAECKYNVDVMNWRLISFPNS